MPQVVFHKGGQVHRDEVKENSNLVVRAGIRQFPFPHLRYECGMGKCAKCACKVLNGAEHLPPPNWKEKKQLGPRLDEGYRLLCQLWIQHDLELLQDDEPVPPFTGAGVAPPAAQTAAAGGPADTPLSS